MPVQLVHNICSISNRRRRAARAITAARAYPPLQGFLLRIFSQRQWQVDVFSLFPQPDFPLIIGDALVQEVGVTAESDDRPVPVQAGILAASSFRVPRMLPCTPTSGWMTSPYGLTMVLSPRLLLARRAARLARRGRK